MAVNENTVIKDWYIATYPTDELGQELNDSITFYGLFESMDNYKDVYEVLGVSDSLVRERCFEQLAKIMKVDYDYIYNQWMLCK
jgi:hypothetical protein